MTYYTCSAINATIVRVCTSDYMELRDVTHDWWYVLNVQIKVYEKACKHKLSYDTKKGYQIKTTNEEQIELQGKKE